MNKIAKRTVLALAAAGSVATLAPSAAAQDAAGDWIGPLEPTPGNRIPLVVHIARDDAGTLGGTMDIPTQGAMGLPLAGVVSGAGSLAFAVPSIGGSYKGQWDADAKLWKGEWTQAGQHFALPLFVPPPPKPFPADWQLPSDADLAGLIADRNAPRPGQGIVLGPDGRRIVAGGTGAAANVNRDTEFEIGSISKVFTALLLADMVNKHEVSLDDPAEKYLPAGHHMPQRNSRQITLRDLATHMSGLPRMPDDMGPANGIENPFEGYGEDKLLAFLGRYQLTRDVGAKWDYSNLGFGLLGYLLGRAAHSDYETLLRQRITGPLGMKDTVVTLSPAQLARLAPPFDRYMRPAKRWDIVLFAGAGGIRSTAPDMLTFAKAVLDPGSPLAAAVKTSLSVRVPGGPGFDQALGWEVLHPAPGTELLEHGGQSGGFQTSLMLDPAKGRAVIGLTNSQAQPAPDDLVLHSLVGASVIPTPAVPAAPPAPSVHTEISLPPKALEKFIGRYDFGSGFTVSVVLEDGTLHVLREGIPGAQAAAIYPEGPAAFFWKVTDAQLRFTIDASGAVTGAQFTSGSVSLPGKRLAP